MSNQHDEERRLACMKRNVKSTDEMLREVKLRLYGDYIRDETFLRILRLLFGWNLQPQRIPLKSGGECECWIDVKGKVVIAHTFSDAQVCNRKFADGYTTYIFPLLYQCGTMAGVKKYEVIRHGRIVELAIEKNLVEELHGICTVDNLPSLCSPQEQSVEIPKDAKVTSDIIRKLLDEFSVWTRQDKYDSYKTELALGEKLIFRKIFPEVHERQPHAVFAKIFKFLYGWEQYSVGEYLYSPKESIAVYVANWLDCVSVHAFRGLCDHFATVRQYVFANGFLTKKSIKYVGITRVLSYTDIMHECEQNEDVASTCFSCLVDEFRSLLRRFRRPNWVDKAKYEQDIQSLVDRLRNVVAEFGIDPNVWVSEMAAERSLASDLLSEFL